MSTTPVIKSSSTTSFISSKHGISSFHTQNHRIPIFICLVASVFGASTAFGVFIYNYTSHNVFGESLFYYSMAFMNEFLLICLCNPLRVTFEHHPLMHFSILSFLSLASIEYMFVPLMRIHFQVQCRLLFLILCLWRILYYHKTLLKWNIIHIDASFYILPILVQLNAWISMLIWLFYTIWMNLESKSMNLYKDMTCSRWMKWNKEHTPENVATRAFALGFISGSGLVIAFLFPHKRGWGLFLTLISLFHLIEYLSIAHTRIKLELNGMSCFMKVNRMNV